MKRKTASVRYEQLDLFRPRANRPRWSDVSDPTKTEVQRLLAQMFLEAATARDDEIGRKEEDDE